MNPINNNNNNNTPNYIIYRGPVGISTVYGNSNTDYSTNSSKWRSILQVDDLTRKYLKTPVESVQKGIEQRNIQFSNAGKNFFCGFEFLDKETKTKIVDLALQKLIGKLEQKEYNYILNCITQTVPTNFDPKDESVNISNINNILQILETEQYTQLQDIEVWVFAQLIKIWDNSRYNKGEKNYLRLILDNQYIDLSINAKYYLLETFEDKIDNDDKYKPYDLKVLNQNDKDYYWYKTLIENLMLIYFHETMMPERRVIINTKETPNSNGQHIRDAVNLIQGIVEASQEPYSNESNNLISKAITNDRNSPRQKSYKDSPELIRLKEIRHYLKSNNNLNETAIEDLEKLINMTIYDLNQKYPESKEAVMKIVNNISLYIMKTQ